MAARKTPSDRSSIRSQRLQRGWSQQRLIQEIRLAAASIGEHQPGVTRPMVSKWERGNRKPSAYYQRLLHIAFTRSLDSSLTDESWSDGLNRRAFLAGASATASLAVVGSLGLEPWQRLTSALQSRSRADDTTIESLSVLNGNLNAMFQPVAPALLINPARSHLDTLTRLLGDTAMTPAVRNRVTSLAAETSVLLGWLSKEDGDPWTAQQFYAAALEAAEEAGDNDLGAYAIASASALPAFRSSPAESLDLLTGTGFRGFDLTKAKTSTRIWIQVLQAEVHTRTADKRAAMKALDGADRLLDRLDPTDGRPPILGHFDHASLQGERGITAVRLGEADGASSVFDEALGELVDYPKTQSRILTNAARAHTQQGDIEQAVSAAARSLNVARQTGSEVGIDDVRALRSELDPWSDSEAVRELDLLLAT